MSWQDEMIQEEKMVDEAIQKFVNNYIASLYSANLEIQLETTKSALQELNDWRKQKGLTEIPLTEELISEATKSAKEYKSLLSEGKGSYICVTAGDTEVLQFYPWLQDFEDDTKLKILETYDTARTEEWTSETLDTELRKIEAFVTNRRARVAAFTETRVAQYQAQMRTWSYGGLEWVQRRAVKGGGVCTTCAALDNRVFRLGEEPALSHANCRCFYTCYLTKAAWSPDYPKELYDPEGYTVGPDWKERGKQAAFPPAKKFTGKGRKPEKLEIREVDEMLSNRAGNKATLEARKKAIDTGKKKALPKDTLEKFFEPDKLETALKVIARKAADVKKFTEYVPAQSMQEAEQWLLQHGVKTIDIKSMDLQVVNDLNRSLNFHYQLDSDLSKFTSYVGNMKKQIDESNSFDLEQLLNRELKKGKKKEIAEKIAKKNLDPTQYKEDVYTHYVYRGVDDKYTGVGVNRLYGVDYDEFANYLKHDVQLGYHPIGVDNPKAIFDHELGHTLDVKYKLSNDPAIKAVLKKYSKEEIKVGLSEYASKSEHEFIAEAWAEFLNNPSPRQISKEIGELILDRTRNESLIGSDMNALFYAEKAKKMTEKQKLLIELEKHVSPSKLAEYEKQTTKELRKRLAYYEKKAEKVVIEAPIPEVEVPIIETPKVKTAEELLAEEKENLIAELKPYYRPSEWYYVKQENLEYLTEALERKKLESFVDNSALWEKHEKFVKDVQTFTDVEIDEKLRIQYKPEYWYGDVQKLSKEEKIEKLIWHDDNRSSPGSTLLKIWERREKNRKIIENLSDEEIDLKLKGYYSPYSWEHNGATLSRTEKIERWLTEYEKVKNPPYAEFYPDLNPELKAKLEKEARLPKPSDVVFKPSKTVSEAQKWIEQSYGIETVSYRDLDVQTANAINESLDYHMKLDPSIKKRINYLGSIKDNLNVKLEEDITTANKLKNLKQREKAIKEAEDRIRDLRKDHFDSYAYYSPDYTSGGGGIAINERYGANPDMFLYQLIQNEASGWHPVGTSNLRSVIDHELGHTLDSVHRIFLKKEIIKLYEEQTESSLTKNLSRYAKTNIGEFIAEGWSEYINSSKPRPLAKMIGDIILNAIKEDEKYL